MSGLESIYKATRLRHYRRLFAAIREKAGSLSATEAFSAEIIYLLDGPTIGEFASFIGISQPNASYKVASLVTKGYIHKVPCETDKRECRLMVSDKFMEYYGSALPDLSLLPGEFTSEEIKLLEKIGARLSQTELDLDGRQDL